MFLHKIGSWLSKDTQVGMKVDVGDSHLSRSVTFLSLLVLSVSASLRATMSLSTSAWDFLDSSL